MGTVSKNHPIRQLFFVLAERGLEQAKLQDKDILLYLADLMVDFLFVENVYRMKDTDGKRITYLVDMFTLATDAEMPDKKEYYKHIGDYSLFMLGMFPESLERPRRVLSPSYYSESGRMGYHVAGELENRSWQTVVYRKLAERFEQCVFSLNRVRDYTHDPFYQLMLREFRVT